MKTNTQIATKSRAELLRDTSPAAKVASAVEGLWAVELLRDGGCAFPLTEYTAEFADLVPLPGDTMDDLVIEAQNRLRAAREAWRLRLEDMNRAYLWAPAECGDDVVRT